MMLLKRITLLAIGNKNRDYRSNQTDFINYGNTQEPDNREAQNKWYVYLHTKPNSFLDIEIHNVFHQ